MIRAARKNRSARTDSTNQEGSASFSLSLVEEIRKKLEVEQKSAWFSGGGGVVRGSSFDIPADSCCNYNHVSGPTCYPAPAPATDINLPRHSELERNEHFETGLTGNLKFVSFSINT